jgi:hypothetical protein
LLRLQPSKRTQTANSIAKRALAEVNKPYVMFSALNPNHTHDANGQHLRVGFTFTNFGNTPASYLRYNNCDPIIVDFGVTPILKCNLSEKGSDEINVGPKQPINFSGSIIKEADLEDTRIDKKSIYIMGYVTYQDSIDVDPYGNPEQRETRICQKIQIPTIKTIQVPRVGATAAPSDMTGTTPASDIPDPQIPATVAPIIGLGCPGFSCIDSSCQPMH